MFTLTSQPKDMAAISERRKEFNQNNIQTNQRYHAEEVEERFAKYKPGFLRQEHYLCTTNTIFIYSHTVSIVKSKSVS